MRTTIDLPDELLQRARVAAARERTTLTALLADGLQLRLATPRASDSAPPGALPLSEAGGGLQPWVDPASNASLLDATDALLDATDGDDAAA